MEELVESQNHTSNFTDASRGAANTAILNELTAESPLGLTVERLVDFLGFEDKNQLIPRLRDLQGRGLIEPMVGGSWRIVQDKQKAAIDIGDASAFFPPSPKFVSYKNSLQIYCQRKRMAVPSYTVVRFQSGYRGMVKFGTQQFESECQMPTPKDAEQRVAFDALLKLGLGGSENSFVSTKALKRNSTSEDPIVPSKVAKLYPVSHKSTLHELSQKNRLPAPTYEVTYDDKGFLALVTFNGRQFTANKPCSSKKEAEQLAAYVALYQGGHITPPSSPSVASTEEENKIQVMDQSADVISIVKEPIVPSASAKNLLQEYCQKKSMNLPSYRTTPSEGGFISTVTVADLNCEGHTETTKKGAEKSAAAVALKTLGVAS